MENNVIKKIAHKAHKGYAAKVVRITPAHNPAHKLRWDEWKARNSAAQASAQPLRITHAHKPAHNPRA